MRVALVVVGFLFCFVGAEFLFVDKIVLHEYPRKSAETVAVPERGQGPRVIDLPDSGGYVLVAVGVVCLMYFVALRGKKRPE